MMMLKLLLAILLIALVVAIGLGLTRLTGTRIVARALAPNGTELYVGQKFNWSGEPFTTGFHYRTAGGRWGWCYYDHQDSLWSSGDIELDADNKRATVLRQGKPVILFDWETETYVSLRRNQTNTAPGNWRPAGEVPDWWTPDSGQ